MPSVCALLPGPHPCELDERRGGQAHVLDADPLALAVCVVAAREDIRRGQTHLGQRGAVGSTADRRLPRLESDAANRLLEVGHELRIPRESISRVEGRYAYLELH